MIAVKTYDPSAKTAVFKRSTPLNDVSAAVSAIIESVKNEGDAALKRYALQFDGAAPETLEVSQEEWAQALKEADPKLIAIMEEAAGNIRAFHDRQVRTGFEMRRPDGAVVGQRVLPVKRAGVYVPGGTAAYFSTVLMNGIPAKAAGVREVVMVTPAKNGRISPDILAAARIAGIDRVFRVGGAQAIAALAYGTETIPKADRIVGPGNAYVAEAKKQIFGIAGIDMIAGPSEILVVADKDNAPDVLAADLLSQAEHDRDASAVLVTDDEALAECVRQEIERQLETLPREDIARASIDRNGLIIIAKDIGEAVGIANEWAPEHLELCVKEPFKWLPKVENAGSVFLGRSTPEAVGDYWAGANHTLPTGGTARFSSPLSVEDFMKVSQYIYYPDQAAREAAPKIAYFAEREGLKAHAVSALKRL